MSRPSLVEEIFLAALEKRALEERAAFLDGACRGDSRLRDEVERLLLAHPSAGRFLEPPVAEATADFASRDEKAGVVIAGRYKLLEPIGEGGMGSVWMAQQTEPVKRTVALKLIKEGMDTRAVLARFEAERQALALMDHPNIARVLDAGSTSDGRPFFVMELVKGVPITKYCDERKLTLRQRLELFIPVCQAVQHAHQKGVIHRDLKPSNVLVARYDDQPVPKVIDFGVAKAAGQPLTDHTLVTGFGAVVGTPEYMSPEQAQFNQLDIDTRSDVYALGVLLYELLTGSTPFTRKEFEKAGLLEILRVIREQEPPRPSTRLSTADALPTLAANRGSEPKALAGLLKNDLDWIVMKAMEKDRNRRYETATGFAADVQRYLAGEAVQAHPPSTAYRLKKFGRKHRVALVTAMAFVGLLIAAVGISAMLAVKARRAERLAEAKAKEADENADLYWKVAEKEQDARNSLSLARDSLRIDLDLAELENDKRVGLLKLVRDCPWYSPHSLVVEMTDSYMDVTWTEADGTVRTNSKKPKTLKRPVANLKDFPIKRDRIRQFATMAILANGQTFAPLLPPITHDGLEFEVSYLSSTGQRLLTRGADTTARLWDTVTARQIANLRQGDEKVIGIGLSPDGLTALTKSSDGVIRFWETKNGAFRAATEPRPELPEFQLSNDRLLTFPRIPEGDKDSGRPGPAELWDANTGRHIARLEIPNVLRYTVEFFGNGRWINVSNANSSQGHTNANSSQAVFSSSDGRLFAQLNYKNMSDIKAGQTPELSPSGHIATTVADTDRGHFVHAWDTSCWQLISITGPWTGNQMILRNARPISDEMFAASNNFYYVDKTEIYRFGSDKATATFPGVLSKIEGDRALLESGQIFETHTWKRLNPPKGRKYHPDIARFALDGRFIQWKGDEVLDAQTEKTFHLGLGDMGGDGSLDRYDPKTGWIGIVMENLRRLSLRLPPPDHLDIHSDLLKLWAQVAVRGELDEEGVFKKWNEETWEKKRQELASEPAPYADFPFPGYVAQDRLHWLRKEYEAASEAEQPRLARQLLDRAEKAGDASEATRWRAILAPKASLPAGAK